MVDNSAELERLRREKDEENQRLQRENAALQREKTQADKENQRLQREIREKERQNTEQQKRITELQRKEQGNKKRNKRIELQKEKSTLEKQVAELRVQNTQAQAKAINPDDFSPQQCRAIITTLGPKAAQLTCQEKRGQWNKDNQRGLQEKSTKETQPYQSHESLQQANQKLQDRITKLEECIKSSSELLTQPSPMTVAKVAGASVFKWLPSVVGSYFSGDTSAQPAFLEKNNKNKV